MNRTDYAGSTRNSGVRAAVAHAVRAAWTVLLLGGCETTGPSACDDLVPTACGSFPAPSQYLADLRQDDVAQRPAQGTAVRLQYLSVAAIDSYTDAPTNQIGNIYLEQYVSAYDLANNPHFAGVTGCAPYMGGAMCGVQVFGATIVPVGTHLIPGDIVHANGGTYDEFTCATCRTPVPPGASLPELSRVELERAGSASTPVVVPVSLADLGAHAIDYLGVLVTLTDATIAVGQDTRGSPTIGQGAVQFALTTDLSPLQDGAGTAVVPNCTSLAHLTGIVSYFYNPQLLPRAERHRHRAQQLPIDVSDAVSARGRTARRRRVSQSRLSRQPDPITPFTA